MTVWEVYQVQVILDFSLSRFSSVMSQHMQSGSTSTWTICTSMKLSLRGCSQGDSRLLYLLGLTQPGHRSISYFCSDEWGILLVSGLFWVKTGICVMRACMFVRVYLYKCPFVIIKNARSDLSLPLPLCGLLVQVPWSESQYPNVHQHNGKT